MVGMGQEGLFFIFVFFWGGRAIRPSSLGSSILVIPFHKVLHLQALVFSYMLLVSLLFNMMDPCRVKQ